MLKIILLYIRIIFIGGMGFEGDVDVGHIPDFLSFSGDVLYAYALLVLVITCCPARVDCAFNAIQWARLVVLCW
jgi:hypothetical protein